MSITWQDIFEFLPFFTLDGGLRILLFKMSTEFHLFWQWWIWIAGESNIDLNQNNIEKTGKMLDIFNDIFKCIYVKELILNFHLNVIEVYSRWFN